MSHLLDSLLDAERMANILEHDRRVMTGEGYRWPAVDAKVHPARHNSVPVQHRTGPRSDS